MSAEECETNEKSEEEKLTKLKELLGYWIHENINEDEWDEYERRYDKKWIDKEALSTLLSKETLEVVNDENIEDYKRAFEYFETVGNRKIQDRTQTTLMRSIASLLCKMTRTNTR